MVIVQVDGGRIARNVTEEIIGRRIVGVPGRIPGACFQGKISCVFS
jgi:membrane-associated protease RseP (regulator of RpoE activity)